MRKDEQPEKRGLALRQDEQSSYRKGKSYFLGIGIDEYVHKHQFHTLYNAVFDVKTIGNILVRDFEFEKVRFLIDKDATRTEVFNTLFSYAQDLGDQDKLLVYFAGHGGKVISLNNSYPYWACHDSNRDDPSSLLENYQIRKLIDDCLAKHIFLISDSCYSGTFLEVTRSSETYPLINGELADEYEKKSSRWVLCSTDENQLASDGKKNLHSPFAQAIVQLLKTYKANYINVGFFIDQVKSIAFERNKDQVPLGGELMGEKHKRGQYVFRPHNNISTTPEITDTNKSISLSFLITPTIAEIRQKAKTASTHLERLRLLYQTQQLQKRYTNQMEITDLFNDLLHVIQKKENHLQLKEKKKCNHAYSPRLQSFIHLFTEQNLKAMENYLRKSCELMLHNMEIPAIENRWSLRDFCEKKSEDLQLLIENSQILERESIHIQTDSDYIYNKTYLLKDEIYRSLDNQNFSDPARFGNELNDLINEQIQHAKFQVDKWILFVEEPGESSKPDIAFQDYLEMIISRLQFLREIFEIVYIKTFEIDFSLT